MDDEVREVLMKLSADVASLKLHSAAHAHFLSMLISEHLSDSAAMKELVSEGMKAALLNAAVSDDMSERLERIVLGLVQGKPEWP